VITHCLIRAVIQTNFPPVKFKSLITNQTQFLNHIIFNLFKYFICMLISFFILVASIIKVNKYKIIFDRENAVKVSHHNVKINWKID